MLWRRENCESEEHLEMFKLVQQTRQQLRVGVGSYRSRFGNGWFWKLLVGHDAAPVNGSWLMAHDLQYEKLKDEL